MLQINFLRCGKKSFEEKVLPPLHHAVVTDSIKEIVAKSEIYYFWHDVSQG
jgi:hypothetical protein